MFKEDSAAIQNDLILCVANEVREVVRREAQEAEFLAVQVDDTTDIGTQTQCTIIIRYLRGSEPVERFVNFVNVSGKSNAHNIASVVQENLEEFLKVDGVIQHDKLVSQTYDGASVMSGAKGGVNKLIQDNYQLALFIHCLGHKLNLVLQKASNGISDCQVFFATLDRLHSFFTRSPNRLASLEKFAERRITIQAPSRTRWTYRSRALNALVEDYLYLVEFFMNITENRRDWDGHTIQSALGFVSTMKEKSFVFVLILMQRIYKLSLQLFTLLQHSRVSIVAPSVSVDRVMKTLADMQSREVFEDIVLNVSRLLSNFSDKEPAEKCSKDDLGHFLLLHN